MSNVNMNELRQRMAKILNEAQTQGHKVQDIIDEEMQDRFPGMKELGTAKEYIKQVEEREKDLQEQKKKLQKELAAAKKAVTDLPEDHQQLVIDFGQLKHEVTFLRGRLDDAETISSRYQQKWLKAAKTQVAVDQKERKIETLQREVARQQTLINNLTDDKHSVTEIVDLLRKDHLIALEQKEIRIMELTNEVQASQESYTELENSSGEIDVAYSDLTRRLEEENGDAVNALNKASATIRRFETERCAAVSEAVILRRFVERSSSVLPVYQKIFQQLLNPERTSVSLPEKLYVKLQASWEECEAFMFVHGAFKAEGLQQCIVRDELAGLARAAKATQKCLQSIALDMEIFLGEVKQEPDRWEAMRQRFGSLGRK